MCVGSQKKHGTTALLYNFFLIFIFYYVRLYTITSR